MYSTIDEKRGLFKTNWQGVRDRVHAVEPEFARIVDEISPDDSFPLYIAYYPYGVLKGDTISSFLPTNRGQMTRICSHDLPLTLKSDFSYVSRGAPLSMLLEKTMELFIDLPQNKITIPYELYKPGDIFPKTAITMNHNTQFAPNGILKTSSGARTAFMLPPISAYSKFDKLSENSPFLIIAS
ncbi:MAG: hypothetical protein ACO2ZM_02150 [Francisellaceae bacterium]